MPFHDRTLRRRQHTENERANVIRAPHVGFTHPDSGASHRAREIARLIRRRRVIVD